MRLPKRRTLWLSAALLLAVIIGAWLFVPRSRVTQENYGRIHEGMSREEVQAILGEGNHWARFYGVKDADGEVCRWDSGMIYINAAFVEDRLLAKDIGFRTAWETLSWYAKQCAAKIGVKGK